MKRALPLALLGLGLAAAGARAQSPSEPQLVFSISAGLAAGGGKLWDLPQQGVTVVGSPTGAIDTVGLERWLVPGPVATLSAQYHRSPHLGLVVEAGYFGLASEQRCEAPPHGYAPDSENKNEQACIRGNGLNVPTSAVSFQAGVVLRGSQTARLKPYVRALAGISFLANSYVRTDGAIEAPMACAETGGICQWPLVEAEHTSETTWAATLAAGTTIAIGTGYHFRFEVRDLVTALQVPTAPAHPSNGLAPVGSVVRHIPVFTAGIDVILERRRGRRY